MSVRAVLPRFAEMEREKRQPGPRQPESAQSPVKNRSASPAALYALKMGVQQMVDAAVAALPAASLRLQQQGLACVR